MRENTPMLLENDYCTKLKLVIRVSLFLYCIISNQNFWSLLKHALKLYDVYSVKYSIFLLFQHRKIKSLHGSGTVYATHCCCYNFYCIGKYPSIFCHLLLELYYIKKETDIATDHSLCRLFIPHRMDIHWFGLVHIFCAKLLLAIADVGNRRINYQRYILTKNIWELCIDFTIRILKNEMVPVCKYWKIIEADRKTEKILHGRETYFVFRYLQ